MKISRILVLLLIFFWGCDDEDELKDIPEPEPVTIFSLAIDADYPLDKNYWIMAHDKNGVLLDHEQIKIAGLVKLETSATVPDGKIAITIFRYEQGGSPSAGIFDSYLAVSVGQEWVWKAAIPPVVGPGISLGEFSASYTLPTPLRMDVFGNNTTFGGATQTGNVKSYHSHIYEDNRNFLLTVAGDGNPRYMFFENVKPGDYFQVPFDQMHEYDRILDISFPPTSNPYVLVYALDEEGKRQYYTYFNGFNLPPYAPSMTLTNLKIGYLDRFEKYYTSIQIPSPNFGFGFEKSGAAPSAITFPGHAPYALTDKSFLNFSYTKELPFDRRRSTFKNDLPGNAIWWVISAPEGNDKIIELPDGFLEIYSFIKLEDFKHVSTVFFRSTKTYTEHIDFVGRGVPESKDFETTTITLQ